MFKKYQLRILFFCGSFFCSMQGWTQSNGAQMYQHFGFNSISQDGKVFQGQAELRFASKLAAQEKSEINIRPLAAYEVDLGGPFELSFTIPEQYLFEVVGFDLNQVSLEATNGAGFGQRVFRIGCKVNKLKSFFLSDSMREEFEIPQDSSSYSYQAEFSKCDQSFVVVKVVKLNNIKNVFEAFALHIFLLRDVELEGIHAFQDRVRLAKTESSDGEIFIDWKFQVQHQSSKRL